MPRIPSSNYEQIPFGYEHRQRMDEAFRAALLAAVARGDERRDNAEHKGGHQAPDLRTSARRYAVDYRI
jgi:hypothetical protein